MAKIIGIDLGTTNSAMAIMEGSSPEILVKEMTGKTPNMDVNPDEVVAMARMCRAVS